ncbi:MAG TPA: hypothetical protein VHG29_09855 [Novosphingobium sp.]|nr:hypothetical protein [Novosphingobium sp.]
MHLHADIRALRDDDGPQRAAQQALGVALDAWRARPGPQRLEAELAQFTRGGPIDEFPLLATLFEPHSADAAVFVRGLIDGFCAALERAPLGHLPLRHFTDGTVSTLMLARSGEASLALAAIDGPRLALRAAPGSVSFAPCETWDHILAGEASADLVSRGEVVGSGTTLTRKTLHLKPGGVTVRDGAREALVIRVVSGCLVNLRLQRRRTVEVTREFSLGDGTLLHQAAGTARDSRLELTAALLGRMGRADAAPLLGAMAQENGSPALRWQALRECLGLDTREGFLTLGTIARSPHDPLAVPAGALRAQLIEQHPQLAGIEPCPL